LRFADVWKEFPDGTQALRGLCIDVEAGEFLVLVGPSGCGKSTALRILAGLEEASRGDIRIGGQVVNDFTAKQRNIAMVFQNYALYPHMTVAKNMGFALRMERVNKGEIRRRVGEAAQILGLTDLLGRKPGALSGGQRQRVAMGRAIVRNPAVFLMDEPLSNLDAKLRVHMRAEIAELQNRLGVTTVYVTHDQVEAMTMGHRVAVLNHGVLQQIGPPQELFRRPTNVFVASFIGSPAMNLLMGTVRHQEDSSFCVDVGSDRLGVPAEALEKHPQLAEFVDREVIVGLRPEFFRRPEIEDASQMRELRDRRVALVELIGSETLVHVSTDAAPAITTGITDAVGDPADLDIIASEVSGGGFQIIARFDGADAPGIGETISLAFDTRYLHFFDPGTGTTLSGSS
jgi:multiple sugar transport system ATP-binding protein